MGSEFNWIKSFSKIVCNLQKVEQWLTTGNEGLGENNKGVERSLVEIFSPSSEN
jgi:hypothetical protein